jgi:hypothetical protein
MGLAEAILAPETITAAARTHLTDCNALAKINMTNFWMHHQI